MVLTELLEAIGVCENPICVYDAPCSSEFQPVSKLKRCIFQHYEDWQNGWHAALSKTVKCCPGCGHWLLGMDTFPSREVFAKFLAVKEGLFESCELAEELLTVRKRYHPENDCLYIGPEVSGMEEFLKTVSFFVTADQLSFLSLGATYHASPSDTGPILAPFGSGCGQMLAMFPDVHMPLAIIGATDIAMRSYIPAEKLMFTVTRPMLERLLSIDPEQSFLGKSFSAKLKKARSEARV